MKVKALKPFTINNSGDLTSVACGAVIEVESTEGNQLITDGLAEEYTLVNPTGTKSITANANDIDVAEYAKANVNVPQPSGSETITVNGTYDITNKAEVVINVGVVTLAYNGNGATDELGDETVRQQYASGNVVESAYPDWYSGSDPVTVLGWASTKAKADAHEYDVTFPLTVTENRTIYLDWTTASEE